MLIISYFLIIALVFSFIIMLLLKVLPLFSHQEQRKPSLSTDNEFSQELAPQKDQTSISSPEIMRDGDQRVQMVLLAKNPTSLYAFCPPSHKWGSGRTLLNVYQITNNLAPDEGQFLFDLEIEPDRNCWFINVPYDNSLYYVVLGARNEDGTFHELLRSNMVETPRASLSAALDASWIPCDVYRDLGDICAGVSSTMLQKSERTDH